MENFKKYTIKIAPWIIIGLIGFFFYRSLSGNVNKLDGVDFGVSIWSILGVLSFTLAIIISGVIWGRLLSTLSVMRVRVDDAVRIHCASWLLKYIPGQVGSFLNKVAWGHKNGFSKKTISTSFIYENVLMVIAGFALALPVLFIFREQIGDNVSTFIPLLVIIPLSVVLSRKLFYTLLNVLMRLTGRKLFNYSDFLSTKSLVSYQLAYLIPRLLNGVGFVLIVYALVPIDPSMYVGLGATYILASIIGLLAVFVPGGLGVREAVIVAFLSVYFPVEQAIIIALIVRVYATISDIGVGLIYLVLNRGRIIQR